MSRFAKSDRLAYLALVNPDGNFLAHSTVEQVGKRAVEVVGERQHWGEIECIECADEQGRELQEFRLPLRGGDEHFATLRMGIVQPNALSMIVSSAELLPLAVLGPLALLAVGAVVLQRIVRPLSEVDGQLRRVAVAPDLQQVSSEQSACARAWIAGMESPGERVGERCVPFGFRGAHRGGMQIAGQHQEQCVAQQSSRRYCHDR